VFGHRAAKDAAAAQRAKDKAKRKGSFFGFGGSSASNKEVEERDAEQDYDDQQEVHLCWMSCSCSLGVRGQLRERLRLSCRTFNMFSAVFRLRSLACLVPFLPTY
jgi:hypothetical protein